MTEPQARFIARACRLADTALFPNVSELAQVLRLMWPTDAGRWLTDEAWHVLDARCVGAIVRSFDNE